MSARSCLFPGILLCLCITSSGEQVQCGTTPAIDKVLAISGRIYGGETATYGQVPWQINVFENNVHKCGGTLIASKWVLTAAHCVILSALNRNTMKLYKLIAGEHDITKDDSHQQVRYGIQVMIHSGYKQVTSRNDIALLEADRPYDMDHFVVPACLPNFDETPFPYTECLVSGWGFTSPTTKPEVLQVLGIPVLHQKLCSAIHHPGQQTSFLLTSKMLCAGYVAGKKDSCQGDSGGPLVCPRYGEGPNGHKVITGIVSWGQGCARVNQAGVYVRVESYLTWINTALALPPTINTNPCKYSGVRTTDRQQGVIVSPGYTETAVYANDLHCQWEIDLSMLTTQSSKLVLSFDDFDLEAGASGTCRYDYVQIFSGERFKQLRGTFCGNQLPPNMTFEQQDGSKLQFRFVFHSDITMGKRGFSSRFSVV